MKIRLPARIRGAMLLSLFAAAMSSAATPGEQCDERASPTDLIARPGDYHGKVLWIVAHVRIGFENLSACTSEFQPGMDDCVWLEIDEPFRADPAAFESRFATWKQFDRRTVAIRARFNKDLGGHLGNWQGGLDNILEVSGRQGGWSFSANGAVPRHSCAGELPAKTPNEKILDGDYEGAIADLSRAIELDPGNGDLRLHRAYAKRQRGDAAGAIAEYTQALEIWEEPDKGVLFIARALARESAGDLEGAIADYSRAIELDPVVRAAYEGRRRLRQATGDIAGAAADQVRIEQLNRGE